ncbi:DUF6049 family protein [Actinomyces oris]|uniref:Uncharacterized protein n=1 Tax=Actinomyces oris TaxID=544580 RepID=A0A1Q8V995_9ACTO|nr:DUF6049 family protein [Actinomyces oris]OLO44658.1 hypothetical protein BKH29_06335 [Actinomyces oris]
MTGTTYLCAKVVTTLGSRLRSRAMVTIAALLGVAGLAMWPVIALPAAEADQGSGAILVAQPGGLSADVAPLAPATPSATTASSPPAASEKTGSSGQRAETTTNQVTLSIDALAPEVLHTDQDLILTGTITNGTSQAITGADLVTRVQRSTESTSRGLGRWLTGTDESGLSDPVAVPLGHDLQPGGVSQFSITIPAGELPLTSADQWGPRGVSVALVAQDVSLAQDRSILVWDSGASVAPVRMTVFLPVTASAQEMAVLSGPRTQERSEALSRIHSRVLGLVSMAGDGVVAAVDPALVEALGVTTASLEQAARNSGSQPATPDGAPQSSQSADPSASSAPSAPSAPSTTGPSASPAPSPQSGGTATASPSDKKASQASNEVIQLSAALARAIHTDSLVALPWGDSDTAALAHLQQTGLIETAARRTQESAIVKAGAPTSLTWLASSAADATTVNALPQPASTIIASPESLPPADELTYTPSGLGASGGHAVLIPEQSLSGALTGENARPTGSDQSTQSVQSAQAAELDTRQLLRSNSAILVRQAPALERDVVVAMPRQAASAVQPSVVRERVATLRSVSWARSQPLDALQERAQEEVAAVNEGTSRIERSELPETVIDDNELSTDTLVAAGRTAGTLQSISSVLSEPAAVLGDYTDLQAVVSSASWRADPRTRNAQVPAAEASGTNVTSSLAAVPSSTINVISSEAQLPVRITSSLSQDVTVQVYLVSNNKRLQVPRTTTVRVPAHQQAKVTVPIQAVGSGDVGLRVQVLAADGTTVGTPTTVHMRVRADWEGRGTGIVVGVLVSIVVIGTVRTVRRGRRTAVTPAAQETA